MAWKEEVRVALELAEQAAREAMAIHDRPYRREEKADDAGPVTEADERCNSLIVTGLRRAFPGDFVIGEESGFSGSVPGQGRAWFVDPIDGTIDFIRKNGEWSIMIGLAVDGVATAGVVYQPAADRLSWATSGEGAWQRHAGATAPLRAGVDPDARAAVMVNSRSHPDPRIAELAAAIGVSRSFEHGSVGCKIALIAERRADIYLNRSGKCHMWDCCAPDVILREAGGALVDWNGTALPYEGETTRVSVPFVATTAALLQSVLPKLRAAGA